jgi:coenzyme Q-binding protein COQ10
MPSQKITRRIAHDADHMFDLVADIERYPEFVPGCRAIRVLRRAAPAPVSSLVAEMRIGHRLVTECFTCRVKLDRPALAIDVDFIDGPFTELLNAWRFRRLSDGACEVDFRIEFALKSRRLGVIVGPLFDHVFLRFVDAFESRAAALAPAAFTRRPAPA